MNYYLNVFNWLIYQKRSMPGRNDSIFICFDCTSPNKALDIMKLVY